MTSAAPTLEERVARLEGAYEHMATGAQIVRLGTHVEVLANAVNHALSQIQADLVQMRKSRRRSASARPPAVGSRAPRRGSMGLPQCTAGTPPTRTRGMVTATGWCASRRAVDLA